jgi:hypothetical protein
VRFYPAADRDVSGSLGEMADVLEVLRAPHHDGEHLATRGGSIRRLLRPHPVRALGPAPFPQRPGPHGRKRHPDHVAHLPGVGAADQQADTALPLAGRPGARTLATEDRILRT